jgi:N-acetylmuramoyl-L-alanine amidase
VRTFQQRRGILVDGIVGPHTWSQLVEASWRLGDRGLYLKQPMMRGDDVLVLQARLNALGFDAGREDGIFGEDTSTAVRAFQKEYGVAEDGIFGPASYAALQGLRVDRPGTAALLREQLRTAGARLADALVVIDPGHGGDDRGDVGVNGLSEADLCWDIAGRVAAKLAVRGAHVRFSRTENEGPEASERARRANALDASVFVSLHLNAHDKPAAHGATTFHYVSSGAGAALGESIQTELAKLGLLDCRNHGRSYPLLRETRMPAVIVEPVFITNPDEEKSLEDPDFRDSLAGAIAGGIARYFEST